MNVDKCHKALLCLAEEFRTKTPPDLKSCMQCLLAILNLPVSHEIIAKTNYHLGSLIYRYTCDTKVAQTYLERAYEQTNTPELALIRLQVVAILVDIYLSQNQRQPAKQLLSRAINDTTTSGSGHFYLYWHYRFLLKLSYLNLEDGDYAGTNNLLSSGAQIACATNDTFTRVLFLLSDGMVLLIARKFPGAILHGHPQQHGQQPVDPEQQLVNILATAGNLLETLQGDSSRKEALKVYFLVLQVCLHLNKGLNKSAQPILKLLQQSIQALTNANSPDMLAIEEANFISPNMAENFIWMPKESMCVLVYLLSVLHSMQAGSLEKAQKYSERAFTQIDRLRAQSSEPDQLLETFQTVLLEHMSMCHLVIGSRVMAIRQASQAIQLSYRGGQKFRSKHRPILNTILGYYAMSMSLLEDAEVQFTRVMNDEHATTSLKVMAMLNLALCFLQDDNLRHQKRADIDQLLARPTSEQLSSYSLKAAAYYVHGLKAFCENRLIDSKRSLRESLKMANAEDLNRLTTCSLVLLGKIFDNSESPRESLNMVSPAIKLAGKIPDIHVQSWASSVLRDIYSRDMNSQPHIEAANMHIGFCNRIDEDKLQSANLSEHSCVRWTDF